ncbi:plasmid mobilization protein [Calothrix sp. CCY 0018]|uniref:plasmid mobilization protein n=1 Tax=Calothrix sp. CCY 0018 TaxID=3103864 RepID=UPI0039C6E05A
MKTNNKKVFKAGRKVEPKPKRTSLISLRLTEEEKEVWEAKAEEAGLGNNLSKFIRYCVENRHIAPPAPAINSDTYAELGRIGNNINQIAYAINRAVKMGEPVNTSLAEIEALKPLLQEVKLQLLGMPFQYNPLKNVEK